MYRHSLGLLLLVLALNGLSGASAAIRRVRPGAPGPAHDGATWTQAYLTIQPAIDASAAGDEVWVAAGVYQERVTVKNGVALYGGFAGTEAARDQRDYARNLSVINGAAQGCVVTFQGGAKADTRLDGFTVMNGKAINGGGISCAAASPTIANNTIKGNISTGWGGGITCYGLSSPAILNNAFIGNFAGDVYGDGGAIMCIRDSSPTIVGNLFRGNIAAQNGGAIAMFNNSSPSIRSNIFRGNVSYVLNSGRIEGGPGRAAIGGGAIFGTAANEDYHPVDNSRCDPVIVNNVVAGNSGEQKSGGICLVDSILTNALVANNTVISNSGAGIAWGNTSLRVINNIVAYNEAGLCQMSGQALTATVRDNCVYRNGTVYWDGDYQNIADQTGKNGNIAVNPSLVSVSCGDAHIQPGSPCINAGDNTIVQAGWSDMDGQARQNGVVDIGADEADGTLWNHQLARFYVRPDGSDANNGTSWALARKTIQSAMDLADPVGGEVWVKTGTYNERLVLRPYVYLYGGFAGNEAALADRKPADNKTTLDGQAAGTVVIAQGGYQVSGVDGFTITNGRSSGNGGGIWVSVASPIISGNTITKNAAAYDGGGIEVNAGFPLIMGNTISQNSSLDTVSGKGAGIHCALSGPVIAGNDIGGNNSMAGMAIHASACTPIILDNFIHDNTVVSPYFHANEGAVDLLFCDVVMLRNTLYKNDANVGGGLSMVDVGGRIADNFFISNHAYQQGGGIYLHYVSRDLTLANNTIAGNWADTMYIGDWGGGISLGPLMSATKGPLLVNNILAYNSSGIYRIPPSAYPGPDPTLKNNCFYSNTGYNVNDLANPVGLNGNIAADPKFVSLNPADIHLQAGSPCIDAGDDTALLMGDYAWDGNPRLLGARVDIGATEYGTVAPYTVADVRHALEVLGGRANPTIADAFRLNLVPGWPLPDRITMEDVLALAKRL